MFHPYMGILLKGVKQGDVIKNAIGGKIFK